MARCEGCENQAETTDSMDVPLCRECHDALPVRPALRIIVDGEGPDVRFVEVETADGTSVSPDFIEDLPGGGRAMVFYAIPA